MTKKDIKNRLEYLRQELRAERISYSEILELQSLQKYIDPSDVELLEASGVPEFKKDFQIKSIYDNGGKTVDRYTIIFKNESMALSVSTRPDEYMGVSMFGEAVEGKHLGKKIKFSDLPLDVRQHITNRLA